MSSRRRPAAIIRADPRRIITLNVNGLRAACGKGLGPWLRRQRATVVCLQEVKARIADLNAAAARPRNCHAYFHAAEKPGYSGVALYSRLPPDEVIYGLGWPDFDAEGRFIEARYGRLSVASIYFPSGSSSAARQAAKFDFLDRLRPVLRQWRSSGREYVLCGDWNIAHRPIDLRNWRANQKNSGFLPEERAWLDAVFDEYGFVDAYRCVDPRPEQYTWWSNRGQAWLKNVGWRIDYQIVTPGLRERIRAASIYRDRRFSDHAPLILDYALELEEFGYRVKNCC
jgi:exodeoxyribonuclease-3